MIRIVHTLLVAALVAPSIAYAETKDEWIALGARIHGAFGPFQMAAAHFNRIASERGLPFTAISRGIEVDR